MRTICALVLLLVLVAGAEPANAQVSIGINIGINLPVFPELVVVPGFPVYYAPSVRGNYFFFDGLYWVFNVEDGQWYSSSWYNGPWVWVEPVFVPQPILVIPFRYYAVRPVYWGGWVYDAPPRWGEHWGREWESRRAGWDRWDRSRMVQPAPLPLYQRDFPRDRYPAPTQQVIIHNERYTYRAQDTQVQQERAKIVREQSSGGRKAPEKAPRVVQPSASPRQDGGAAPREQQQAPRVDRPQQTQQPSASPRTDGPAIERGRPDRGRPEPRGPEPQRSEPPAAPREQVAPPQAPRGETVQPPRTEGPAIERGRPDRGRPEPRGPEPQRGAPQPSAPREQVAPEQAPRGEMTQPSAPTQQDGEHGRPDRGRRPQGERGPDRDDGPGQGRR